MKKLIYGAAAALMVLATACGKGESATATNDSLSITYGAMEGYTAAYRTASYTEAQKRAFMDAFEEVFANSDSAAAMAGIQAAASILHDIDEAHQAGFASLDRATVLENYRRAYLTDSVNMDVISKARDEFREQLMVARDRQVAAEAQATQVNDDAFIAALKAQDSSVQTTASGLSYKIVNPGEGTHPTAQSTVRVKYTGKHTNGEVFDTSGDETVDFSLEHLIPGFTEGTQLIGKGGKITLYIPGNLAYGPNGQPAAGIGPNEMLVFDVELVDINPAN